MDSLIHCFALGLLVLFLVRLTLCQGRGQLLARRRQVAVLARRGTEPFLGHNQ